ncbi:hypothetical protein Tco_0450468 [Tanacetum coccineum]
MLKEDETRSDLGDDVNLGNSKDVKLDNEDSDSENDVEEDDNKTTILGWHLEEIHVTWAHLEKKRIRLRTYTISLEESCSQSVETASRVSSDGVRTFEVTASQVSSDGVRTWPT